jgi:hypothetical protein
VHYPPTESGQISRKWDNRFKGPSGYWGDAKMKRRVVEDPMEGRWGACGAGDLNRRWCTAYGCSFKVM